MAERLPSYKGCFGCGKENPIGLKLERFWDEERHVVFSDFTLSRLYEGFENVIHGGIISTIADELIWWVIAAEKRQCTVTVELTVKFKRPLAPETPYRGEAFILEEKGRRFTARCEIKDREGNILAEATGVFLALKESAWREFLDGLEDPTFFD
ncbi:MAG: PaaI family thioesterase [Deferribacteres bacterium]|nr:PaaI family thioesterase [Deferribacteres bacterium]